MHNTPLLTVDCILFDEGKVLLVRRRFEPFKGCYALPGGFVDISESVETACVRELKEETGLNVDVSSLQLVGVYSKPNRDPRRHTVSVAFLGSASFNNLKAGDDAVSVELVDDWRNKTIAFDHLDIIKDAWDIWINNRG